MKLKGNFDMPGLINPPISHKPRPIYGALHVPKDGRLTVFRKRVKIVKRGFGHHYWNYKGKDVCPVHKHQDQWVISTR